MAPQPPIGDVAARLRALRPHARRTIGPDASTLDKARWAEASQEFDALLLRAALMLGIDIGQATPAAPPVLSERQRDLLEADLASEGLDLRG